MFPVNEGDSLPEERERAAVVLAGPRRGDHWQTDQDPDDCFDFFDVKGVVEAVLDRLGLEVEFDAPEPAAAATPFRAGRSATVVLAGDDEPVGRLGEVHPAVAANFDLEPAATPKCGRTSR